MKKEYRFKSEQNWVEIFGLKKSFDKNQLMGWPYHV